MSLKSDYCQLLKLAQSRRLSPRQLLEPFWRYLAFAALRDFTTKPKLTQLLAELVDMSLPDFILYIHGYAMPWLVLTKRRDVIQSIAEVRHEEEPWQPCLDNANLGQILALLMIQEVEDVYEYSMTLLRHISPHFDGLTLVALLQMEPLLTTMELLKAAGDADEKRKIPVSIAKYGFFTLLYIV
jgi:serine/threonine-protein kinase ATR